MKGLRQQRDYAAALAQTVEAVLTFDRLPSLGDLAQRLGLDRSTVLRRLRALAHRPMWFAAITIERLKAYAAQINAIPELILALAHHIEPVASPPQEVLAKRGTSPHASSDALPSVNF